MAQLQYRIAFGSTVYMGINAGGQYLLPLQDTSLMTISTSFVGILPMFSAYLGFLL